MFALVYIIYGVNIVRW